MKNFSDVLRYLCEEAERGVAVTMVHVLEEHYPRVFREAAPGLFSRMPDVALPDGFTIHGPLGHRVIICRAEQQAELKLETP
jgi:hypothetical protein